jgi:hypothetical protein
MTVCEDPPAKVFGGGEVGIGGEGPPAKLFGESPPEKRCLGGDDVGVVNENGGEACHAEGNVDIGTDDACRRPEKSRENTPKLISCIV